MFPMAAPPPAKVIVAWCVEEDRFLPHDPDGYLREFQKAGPSADRAILEYLTESLQCYFICYFSNCLLT
jgi:hypothetical protein